MKLSTIEIENSKDFEYELRYLNRLDSLDSNNVGIIGDENVEAFLSRKPGTFELAVNARLVDDDEPGLSFRMNNAVYKITKTGRTSSSTEFLVNKRVTFQTKIEINTFHSIDFTKTGLFKMLFIVDVNEIRTFHDEFETVTHQRLGRNFFYDCLRVKLDDRNYDITQLKSEGKGFYIFECLESQDFDFFSAACFSIRQAIGFVNKLMVGGEEFVFDENGGLYYSNYIRSTIKGMYSPITTNPYSYLDIDRTSAEKFYNNLTRITLANLSALAYKIHNEPEFSVAILVILEATSIGSLLIIPSSFAVIIEQLSKHLSIQEAGLDKPVTDPIVEAAILTGLYKVIDDNSNTLSDENVIKLKRRLKEVNRPVNKERLTNNEKLTRPFEQQGIKLSLHDIAIIEHRNDLLHGNILLKMETTRDEKHTDLYMAYVSAKLFTLISKLILKCVGYNGYVYNQGKYLEKHMNIQTNEDYFEKI